MSAGNSMADSNQSRRADFADLSENDPFAELTRIMGHDPRDAEPAPEAPSSESVDDFSIDLERELMGELDFAEFDEPSRLDASEPVLADWRDEVVRPDYGAEATYAADATYEHEIEVDHSVEDLAASIMDSFEADEAALHPSDAELHGEPVALDAADAPATMRAVEMDEEPLDDLPEQELSGWDTPGGMARVADMADEPATDPILETAADEALSFESADVSGYADLDVVAFDKPGDVGTAGYDNSDERVDPSISDAVDLAAPAEIAPAPSLEDELNALLSAGDEAIEAERAAYEPEPASDAVGYVETSYEPQLASTAESVEPGEDWRPVVNTFGRANFSAPRAVPSEQPSIGNDLDDASAMEAELDRAAFAEIPEWDDPEADLVEAEPVAAAGWSTQYDEPEPVESAPVAIEEERVEDDVFSSIFADALAQEQTDKPAGSTAAELDEVLSHFSVAEPRDDYAVEVAAHRPAAPAAAPEVETVDVAEAAYAVSDDLDLPDIDYGAPAPQPAAFDDFDGDFAHAFDDAAAGQQADHASTWDQAQPYAVHASAESAPQAAPAGAYALGEGEWQADDLALGDDFAFDDEFDQALANSVQESEAHEQPRSRRGLLVAAAVAGVAVFGGIGILGMSLFGGGSDTPAVVRADTDPMKVRPENPGGTVVPNQNSEAYNRVSGGADAAAPEQERLITTTEEPVDIAAETNPPALPSGISDGDEQVALAETDPAETSAAPMVPKSEERIEPVADEPEGVGASDDLLAVTPRKVRTMIVRPDGTMVPREMTAEPDTSVPEETVIAAAPLAAPALAPATLPSVEQGAPLAAGEDAGPSVDTPATVAVVPSQRTEPPAAAPAVAGQPAPPPVAQTPPATPVSAPAAAAPAAAASSEWSMQIASQPTAESAQATYQDLARRYGGVLEGRGVNIVRADIAGKGTYYRVRIPSASRDEAINLCTQYKSAGGSCFVSR
jgi:hypothetical protein